MRDMVAARFARWRHDKPPTVPPCQFHQWVEYGDVTWVRPDFTSPDAPRERVLLILCETCGITPLEAVTDA